MMLLQRRGRLPRLLHGESPPHQCAGQQTGHQPGEQIDRLDCVPGHQTAEDEFEDVRVLADPTELGIVLPG